jgi:hypothetical protein
VPWTGKSFKKHVGGLTPAQYRRGAAAATEVLARTGDEGQAVRVGISAAKGRAKRGKKRARLPMPKGM